MTSPSSNGIACSTMSAEPSSAPSPTGRAANRAASLFDFLADVPPPKPSVEPIGFAHNGFHVDEEQRFQPLSRVEAREEAPPPSETRKPDVLEPRLPIGLRQPRPSRKSG